MIVRVVGYVREPAGPEGRSAFAQQEELRRFAADGGLTLVAVCQDGAGNQAPAERNGYRSMLAVVAAGGVDAVLLPGLDTLSPDQIVQEILLWDLRGRGVRVVSTRPDDVELLDGESPQGPSRMLIRDVLERVEQHRRSLHDRDTDVVVHLSPAE
jgi:DNA invertase Pin-like site-specific DNA recombinase